LCVTSHLYKFSNKHFVDAGLHWAENPPKELEAATKEMLERTADKTYSPKSNGNLQKRFRAMIEACGWKYHDSPVKAFAPISHDFLEKHSDLLED